MKLSKFKSYLRKQLAEDGDGAINTSSIGGTAYDASGDVTTPMFNNAAYYSSKSSKTINRRKTKKHNKRKKNESFDYQTYVDNI